ncbi:MAG TPA: ribosome assembly RNA-binding protein YhbY [Burkholderiaceae bacterium]|nr:ribosome assembly RNA-binding protein YhbY [Burkholderiaceae bacterium]
MPEIQLTPKERQALKARGHGLKPVVLLGNSGLSAPVMKEIDRALAAHELIKVKVPGDDREEREALFAEVAEALSAARVQAIGKLLLFYRPAPDEAAPAKGVKPAKAARPARPRAPSAERSPKAPARRIGTATRAKAAGKPSAPKRSTADRRDAERVNRASAPRRDPGAAMRAVGRTNVAKRGGGRAR